MVARQELEDRIDEQKHGYALSEIVKGPRVSTKLRTAEDFGFVSDNYYTAEQKMQKHNREGGLVGSTFSGR